MVHQILIDAVYICANLYVMQMNWWVIPVAACVPVIVSMLYFNPRVLGGAWLSSLGKAPNASQLSMTKMVLASLVYGLLAAVALVPMTLHANHVYSLFQGREELADPNSALSQLINQVIFESGDRFRTFKHGAFHGLLTAVFAVLPVIGLSAMFEQRGWRYVAIQWGFWAICLCIMGGIINAFA
jgi:hypothetical protein